MKCLLRWSSSYFVWLYCGGNLREIIILRSNIVIPYRHFCKYIRLFGTLFFDLHTWLYLNARNSLKGAFLLLLGSTATLRKLLILDNHGTVLKSTLRKKRNSVIPASVEAKIYGFYKVRLDRTIVVGAKELYEGKSMLVEAKSMIPVDE